MTLIHFSFCSAFILGLTGLALNRSHLLSALLCLEGTMLSMYVGLCIWPTSTMSFSFSLIPMLMLTFSACEAATGLALMVATTRTHGTDKLFSLNLLQC
uniref:NADH-ubiquinone oxidoreductase chain 4L n=1 Tax=Xenopus laevis TaxID=8355 RepID=F6KDE3_XENLA|nr:NADH dehydrogenase subunit 4L [Xenopus laevis]QEQ13431.1 NADH dehydrogenase subunit 4L [Xenopus laevis]QEQ13444.1 NADH dehydrogenase subunit 4L [Xenopus laevis]